MPRGRNFEKQTASLPFPGPSLLLLKGVRTPGMAKTAKTAAATADVALSKTLQSRKAKSAVRKSHAKTAKSTPTPAVEGARTTKSQDAAAALAAAQAVATPEVVLRAFDLELQYGPCTGLTRLERWERAKQLGFEPPESICKLLKELPASQQISVFGRL